MGFSKETKLKIIFLIDNPLKFVIHKLSESAVSQGMGHLCITMVPFSDFENTRVVPNDLYRFFKHFKNV